MITHSKLYGLIGYPLTHSFSKKYFTEKFSKEKITDCCYELFPIESIGLLPDLFIQYPDLMGINVTIPYKEAVLSFLHRSSQAVQEIGACNCIHIQNGEMVGYNTDVIGFETMLLPHVKPHHTDALILGTGGAAKAVAWVLQKLGIRFSFVSRNAGIENLQYTQLDQHMIKEHTLIINSTPLGMSPHIDEYPEIPYEFIGSNHLCVDLIYNPSVTKFLALSQKQGATILNGMEMLVIQAEESWKIWNQP
ncbi:MAG: shikimate dehydrogenase family protein [Bacteroidota bacterium]|jgi:shikimate dehydrogenase